MAEWRFLLFTMTVTVKGPICTVIRMASPPFGSVADRLPLLACGSKVVWVCGAGFAEGFAPDGGAGLVLHLEIEARKGEERGC